MSDSSAAGAMRWELWRQDDHGNEFFVREFAHRASAEAARDDYEARGHHQHYWVKAESQTASRP